MNLFTCCFFCIIRGGPKSCAFVTGVPMYPLRLRGVLAELRRYAIGRERLPDPAAAIAPAGERPGVRLGELPVVDIAKPGQPLDKRCDGRRILSVPAAFAQFAPQIAGQLLLAGRIAFDIAQRHGVELSRPKRGAADRKST